MENKQRPKLVSIVSLPDSPFLRGLDSEGEIWLGVESKKSGRVWIKTKSYFDGFDGKITEEGNFEPFEDGPEDTVHIEMEN